MAGSSRKGLGTVDKIGREWLEKIRKAKKNGTTAAPFPGRDPLRWAVRFCEDPADGFLYEYYGKPNVGVAKMLVDRLLNFQGMLAVCLWEFDKKNLITSSENFLTRHVTDVTLTYQNQPLSRLYRPYTRISPVLWAGSGIQRVKYTYHGKERMAYVPSGLEAGEAVWQDHKSWLDTLSGLT